MPPPAPALSVVADTEHRLTHDKDVWVSSAAADSAPYLVPLSFDCGQFADRRRTRSMQETVDLATLSGD